MTEKQILRWIHDNLVPHQLRAMELCRPGLIYSTDWLSGITMREVGFLLARYIEAGMKPKDIWPILKGDYCQRPGEKEKSYHGFGPTQTDIGSYPDFVKSGAWKDPVKSYVMCMQVLEEKRSYLIAHFPDLEGEVLQRAITAAYNCGQGNVRKILAGEVEREGRVISDVDHFTPQHNYSAEVWRYRALYNELA